MPESTVNAATTYLSDDERRQIAEKDAIWDALFSDLNRMGEVCGVGRGGDRRKSNSV